LKQEGGGSRIRRVVVVVEVEVEVEEAELSFCTIVARLNSSRTIENKADYQEIVHSIVNRSAANQAANDYSSRLKSRSWRDVRGV
jgi:hypothetical protein